MSKDAITTAKTSIDSDQIAEIAREVIAHLSANGQQHGHLGDPANQSAALSSAVNQPSPTAAAVKDTVVTAHVIEQLPGNPSQVFLLPNAVITPAARDSARQRGMTLLRTVAFPADQQPSQDQLHITDFEQPARADAVRQQLARRGYTEGSAKIVLSDTPAREVYFQCAKQNEVAVMVASVTDVRRFGEELSPTLWVLDMQRLNFSAAVNAAVQIIQSKKASR